MDLQEQSMNIRGQCPRKEDKKLLKLRLDLCQCAFLQTIGKQTRCQSEVEIVMDPSEHVEKFLLKINKQYYGEIQTKERNTRLTGSYVR